MNELTAKTNEIRRLHAVCRAQRDAVRQALHHQVHLARFINYSLIQTLRKKTCGHTHPIDVHREVRAEYMHAARVLKEVLQDMEG